MKYRKEIDGLRAIAVVPVILFHAGFQRFSGGYVGVDVFFVISGYLITTIIISEITQPSGFSLMRFYERRARRILPALFFVLLVSLPFAYFWMLPFQLKDFGWNLLGAGLFFSNITLWKQGGYFGGPAEENPLLHTWSLSVEEQFYVFFPLITLFIWRFLGWRGLWIVISTALVMSLGLAEWAARHHPTASFYLLPTRAWELAAGALVGMYLYRQPMPSGRLRNPLSLIGLGLILFSVFLFDKGTPFPGIWGLVPVVGTVLIILFASHGTLTHRILSQKLLVGIGLVSYSAYLWHQPLFAFARIHMREPLKPGLLGVLILLTLVMAWISWRYVESPYRKKDQTGRRQIFIFAGLGTATVTAIATLAITTDILKSRYSDFQYQLVAIAPSERGYFVRNRYNRDIRNRPFKESGKRLMIIGDSFSQDFYNMILEVGAFKGYTISASYIPVRCQVYLGSEDVQKFRASEDRPLCESSINQVNEVTIRRARSADVVIFVAGYVDWSAERLLESISNFQFLPSQQVFVLGRKQFGSVDYQKLLSLNPNKLGAYTSKPGELQIRVNKIMSQILPPSLFINLQDIICGEHNDCPLFTAEGELISHDGSHLTPPGSRYVGKLLFSNSVLAKFAPEDGTPEN